MDGVPGVDPVPIRRMLPTTKRRTQLEGRAPGGDLGRPERTGKPSPTPVSLGSNHRMNRVRATGRPRRELRTKPGNRRIVTATEPSAGRIPVGSGADPTHSNSSGPKEHRRTDYSLRARVKPHVGSRIDITSVGTIKRTAHRLFHPTEGGRRIHEDVAAPTGH